MTAATGHDSQAHHLFKMGAFSQAIEICTDTLEDQGNGTDTKKTIELLFLRSACYSKLNQYEKAVVDCTKVLELDSSHDSAHAMRVKALCFMGKLDQAVGAAQKWMEEVPKSNAAPNEYRRLKKLADDLVSNIVSADHSSSGTSTESPEAKDNKTKSEGEDERDCATPTNDDVFESPSTPPRRVSLIEVTGTDCVFCGKSFDSTAHLTRHCSTIAHKRQLLNDSKPGAWKYRAPPSNITADRLGLCVMHGIGQPCSLGENCTFAHGRGELDEWRARLDLRRERIRSARELRLHARSYGEQLIERWIASSQSKSIMSSSVAGVSVTCSCQAHAHVRRKNSNSNWVFTLVTKGHLLRVVSLVDDSKNFVITSISEGPKRHQKHMEVAQGATEWSDPLPANSDRVKSELIYRVKVTFRSEVYGTFHQTVAFDFGFDPVLIQKISVDCRPEMSLENLENELVTAHARKWNINSVTVVKINPKGTLLQRSEFDEMLLERYPPPVDAEVVSRLPSKPEPLTADNYKQRMHDLIYTEEIEQQNRIATYNIRSTMRPVNSFLLVPGMLSAAKYAHDGELFGKVQLQAELSEDCLAGKLILQNVNTVYMCRDTGDVPPTKVYEAILEEKAREFVFIRLSKECVEELNLSIDTYCKIQVQFQLNRIPFCEMHYAIDQIRNHRWIALDPNNNPTQPEPSSISVRCDLDERLNNDQKHVVQLLLQPVTAPWPCPVVMAGPYGTGKTFTIAEATRAIIADNKTNRILIATHSNSAADLYIISHLHARVEAGNEELKPLRVYFEHRWLQTVPVEVLPYTLKNTSSFRKPTQEDLEGYRVIITTLSTSKYLLTLGLPEDFFSHIMVDEGAQALEPEALLPLCLAGPQTKLCVAGDHLQLSPVVYSEVCRELKLDITLLERLFLNMPESCPSRVLLTINYRSHADIVQLTSDLFYNHKLRCGNSSVTSHTKFRPVTVCVCRGEEVKHQNLTGYINLAEVSEVVDRIIELRRSWPTEWGDVNEAIGVVSPYTEQVQAIRSALRKKDLFNVTVERVHNVQGKQFRVLLLSTVRTRDVTSAMTSRTDAPADMEGYLGFLSDEKLLTTALTRAQNLVMIIGDPLILCTVGACRGVWERLMERCGEEDSIHGQTWTSIRSALAGRQLRDVYGLNPLAPEFVPAPDLPAADNRTQSDLYTAAHYAAETELSRAGMVPPYLAAAGASPLLMQPYALHSQLAGLSSLQQSLQLQLLMQMRMAETYQQGVPLVMPGVYPQRLVYFPRQRAAGPGRGQRIPFVPPGSTPGRGHGIPYTGLPLAGVRGPGPAAPGVPSAVGATSTQGLHVAGTHNEVNPRTPSPHSSGSSLSPNANDPLVTASNKPHSPPRASAVPAAAAAIRPQLASRPMPVPTAPGVNPVPTHTVLGASPEVTAHNASTARTVAATAALDRSSPMNVETLARAYSPVQTAVAANIRIRGASVPPGARMPVAPLHSGVLSGELQQRVLRQKALQNYGLHRPIATMGGQPVMIPAALPTHQPLLLGSQTLAAQPVLVPTARMPHSQSLFVAPQKTQTKAAPSTREPSGADQIRFPSNPRPPASFEAAVDKNLSVSPDSSLSFLERLKQRGVPIEDHTSQASGDGLRSDIRSTSSNNRGSCSSGADDSDNESLPAWAASEGEEYDEDDPSYIEKLLNFKISSDERTDKEQHLPLYKRRASMVKASKEIKKLPETEVDDASDDLEEVDPAIVSISRSKVPDNTRKVSRRLEDLSAPYSHAAALFEQAEPRMNPLLRRRCASGSRAPNLRLRTDIGGSLPPARDPVIEDTAQLACGTPMTPSGYYEASDTPTASLLPDALLDSDNDDQDPMEMLRHLDVSDKQYQALYDYFK